MFEKLAPLDAKAHANLRLLPINDYSFARNELMAPIVINELADVAREYPIVFPKGSPFPVAMLGIAKGGNAYVGANGQWLARYIPASLRHYPMATQRVKEQKAKTEDAKPRLVVVLDTESPFVSKTDGEPIFDDKGQPTGLAQEKIKLLNAMQARIGTTQRLILAIEAAGLMTERVITVKTEGAADKKIKGIRVIDEAALNKLDDAAFNKLRASGALPLVYATLLSWANFHQGPIGKAHPLPQTPALMSEDKIRF